MDPNNHTPHHVAIIPDGNRRWAKMKGLPTAEGHRRGFDVATKLIRKSRELGIHTMTLWAFSTENWNREKSEIGVLMMIYEQMIDEYLKEAMEDEVKIVHIGRLDRLNKSLRGKIENAVEKTKEFNKYNLIIALDYGGRDEVVRAIKSMTQDSINTLEETNFNDYLDTKSLLYPSPDLVIRTSGEYRTSGFMIYQAAYAEYMYIEKNFPDFTVHDLEKCVVDYASRTRRFGK